MLSGIFFSGETRFIPVLLGFSLLMLCFNVELQAQQIQSQPSAARPPTATLAQVRQVESDNIEAGIQSQQTIDALDSERRSLSDQYRAALKQASDLQKYNSQLEQLVQSQHEEERSLTLQIERISNLERDVVPLMMDMLDALDEFILLDIPFLLEERRTRVSNLRVLMSNADVTNSEKYRRILEAYQIENDYGRAIEAYEGRVRDSNGQDKTVTFLKIGRIALLYQTLDGEQSYRWKADTQSWQLLDSDLGAQLRNGIKMAREQMPPNLLLIPVDAPSA